MAKQLFSISWHEVHNKMRLGAITEVGKLNRATLNDPALAGILEKIAKKDEFTVAKLGTTAGTATPRKTRRDWGEMPVLDVPIPFTGDAVSFQIGPSSRKTLCLPKKYWCRRISLS